jgi:hypothetical protein
MRVSNKKIGRGGANLGGLRMVGAIRVSMDRGCCGSSDLDFKGCWDSELVEKPWPGRFRI